MKITIIKACVFGNKVLKAGTEVDLDKKSAETLIDAEMAKPAAAKPQEKGEQKGS